MTRWLWVWFVLLLSFPIMPASKLMGTPSAPAADLPAAAAPQARATAPPAGATGPLASLAGLEWVEGHGATAGDLAGRVVLVQFWTFECVNCRRTQPAMHALAKRYAGTDVRVVSVHTPELPRERDAASVARAVRSAGIEYPVALDPEGRAWRAFENRYWPSFYLLDAEGRVRMRHIGELHEGSPAWNDLLRRIDLVSAAGKTARRAGS